MEVPCIKCGETGGVRIAVDDAHDIYCSECDAEYTMDDVTQTMLAWAQIRDWVKLHPARLPGCHKTMVVAE